MEKNKVKRKIKQEGDFVRCLTGKNQFIGKIAYVNSDSYGTKSFFVELPVGHINLTNFTIISGALSKYARRDYCCEDAKFEKDKSYILLLSNNIRILSDLEIMEREIVAEIFK